MNVGDVMTKSPVTVTEDTPLRAAARTMLDLGVSGLPVVDDGGRLVGIVSEADFLELEAARERRPKRLLDALFGIEGQRLAKAERVAEIMTTDPLTVDDTTPLATAARLMRDKGVKRLPVIDGSGRLVGIVSRADLLEAFAQSDDMIRERIAGFLDRGVLPITPGQVTVDVDNGAVRLRGEVDNRSDVRILEQAIALIDGVTAVQNEITWTVNDFKGEKWSAFSQEGKEG